MYWVAHSTLNEISRNTEALCTSILYPTLFERRRATTASLRSVPGSQHHRDINASQNRSPTAGRLCDSSQGQGYRNLDFRHPCSSCPITADGAGICPLALALFGAGLGLGSRPVFDIRHIIENPEN